MGTALLSLVIILSTYSVSRCHAQVIGFNPSNYTVKESDRTLLVTVMVLEGYIPDGENETVTVNTEEGSATGGEDYEEIKDEVLIFDNQTTVHAVTVTVFEDNKQEGDEDFFLVLTLPRIVRRTTLKVNTPIASVLITDTSPEVDHALAIGLGVGIPAFVIIIGVAIAVVIVINRDKICP